MAENVIDTLKLDIIVNTKQNGQSITTLRNSLEKLYKFLNGVKDQDFSKISSDIAKIGNSLTPLIKAVNSLDNQGLKNLTSLGTRLQTLNKRMGEIDAKAMAHKFEQMTQAITPFIDKVMSAQEALVALNNVMGGAKTLTKTATPKATTTTTPKATTNTNILGGNLGKTLNFGSMVAKLYFVRNITKQLGQDLAKVVQYGIDYEETLNLWQTAMRGNISQARVFTSEMTKAYGISSATLMNYQATFKNMLSALGNISETTAYGLSEALTQMALDFSSLYNVSVESAMTKFQAVLSGQVRPIRTAGYDISEQTLFQLYQQIGGTKTVRQLNQTEKQLLRILAVYKQMEKSGATGDLSKTMWTSTANQIRMATEQLKEFATWIGVGFNTLLEKSKILIEINAWLYAGVALAKQFAIEMGYVEKDYGISWSDDIADASNEYEKFKGKLLGFDKFQVLASAGTDDADVEQVLLDSIKAYQGLLDSAGNPAFERSLEILKQIGLELDENGNIVGGFDKVKEKVTDIAKSLGGIITFIGFMTKPWMVFVGAIEYAYWTNEEFRDSMNKMLTQLGGAGLKVFQELAEIFIDIAPVLVEIVEGFAGIIGWLDEMELLDDAIYLVVGALLAWKTIKFIEFIETSIEKLKLLKTQFDLTKVAAAGMAMLGFLVAYDAGKKLFESWDDMSGLERAIEIFKILASAAMIAAAAVAVFHTSWSVGIAAGAIAAGIAVAYGAIEAVKAKQAELEYHANGGLATKGSLFYAGEAGPELVTQTSGGGSTIMNMKQLEDAVARGFIRGFASTDNGYDNDYTTEVYVDGQRLFNIIRGVAKRNGYDFVSVLGGNNAVLS
jgi:hypothetical protein